MAKTAIDIESLNIYQKLAAITAEMPVVEKTLQVENGKNSYSAVREREILEAVKPLEEKYHIFSYPVSRQQTTRIVEKEYMSDGQLRKLNVILSGIEVVYRFVNLDNPAEYVDSVSFGAGMDTGDKAPGKAMTYADKYALMKMYKICTGDANDPDANPSPDEGLLFGDFQRSETNPMVFNRSDNVPAPTASAPATAAKAPATTAKAPATTAKAPAPVTPEPELKMTLAEAKAVVLEIGAMKGKTLAEAAALKPDILEFYAKKFNNPKYPLYKVAAQMLLDERNGVNT